MRGNAEGEMLMQDEKDGEIRAVIPVRPSADWQEKSGEFHIETGVRADSKTNNTCPLLLSAHPMQIDAVYRLRLAAPARNGK